MCLAAIAIYLSGEKNNVNLLLLEEAGINPPQGTLAPAVGAKFSGGDLAGKRDNCAGEWLAGKERIVVAWGFFFFFDTKIKEGRWKI